MASLEHMNKVLTEELSQSEDGRKVVEFLARKKINGYSVGREYTVLHTLKDFLSKINKPLDQVIEQDIVSYCANLEGKPSTQILKRIVIKIFFKYMGKENLVSFIKTSIMPNELRPNDLLIQDEINRMIEIAQQKKYKCMISMFWESCARIGEILSLKIKDLEFDEDCVRITIKNEKNQGTRQIVLFDTKFYLEQYLKSEHSNLQDREAFLFHMKHPINLYRKLSQDSVNATLQMIAQQLGINKPITAHKFRHASITRDVKRGYNEAQLRYKAGWSGTSKMPDRYTHLCNQDIEDTERSLRGLADNKIQLLIPRICPSCNFSNPSDSNYCKLCGSPISDEGVKNSLNLRIEKLEQMLEHLTESSDTNRISKLCQVCNNRNETNKS